MDLNRLSQIADMLAEPSRLAMLVALLDGTSRPAGELAAIAGISRATASEHLGKLVQCDLLARRSMGRHVYYSLSGCEVANAMEALSLAAGSPAPPFRSSVKDPEMRKCRLCYDHLAGQIGVQLFNSMFQRRWLTGGGDDIRLSDEAAEQFGLETQAPRLIGRICLDWSERRDHLGGELGRAIASRLIARDWLQRKPGARALIVTSFGAEMLSDRLGIKFA